MKRDVNSTRSKKWLRRNSLDNEFCREYVDRLCNTQFEFDKYTFGVFNGADTALYITYGLHSYVIFADAENINLKMMEKNSNKVKKENYHELKTFYGDNCWFECLFWIKKRI